MRPRGAEHQDEQGPEAERQREADRRRHHEPERIVRMVVVDAVDDPMEPRADAVLGLEVEHEAVHPVLGQRPEDVAPEHEADDLQCGRLPARADHEQRDDRGHEDDDRDHRMHPRKPVQQVRLEHPRRGLEDVCPACFHRSNLAHVSAPCQAKVRVP